MQKTGRRQQTNCGKRARHRNIQKNVIKQKEKNYFYTHKQAGKSRAIVDFPAFVMEDDMKGPKLYISFLIKWFIIERENNDIQRRIIYESKKS